MKDQKLIQSINELATALKRKTEIHEDPLIFDGIAKRFEVCLEYSWKYFKREATKQGLDAFSPRESIKLAAKIKLIENPETWLNYLENRNLAVHDYLGISDEQYLEMIESFFKEVKTLPAVKG